MDINDLFSMFLRYCFGLRYLSSAWILLEMSKAFTK